jgi:hypothetical protein
MSEANGADDVVGWSLSNAATTYNWEVIRRSLAISYDLDEIDLF